MNEPFLISTAVALILAIAARRYTLWLETDKRKRSFRSFLVEWRAEVSQWPDYWAEKDQAFEAVYKPKLAALYAAKESVRNDFRDKATFDRLANSLGSLKKDDWRYSQTELNKAQKDVILKAMDDFLSFIK